MKFSLVAAALIGYTLFLIFTYLVGHTDFDLFGLFPVQGTTLREAIYASAVEDSVFFTLVTFVTVLAATPAFQSLDTRLQNVYSNRKASDIIKSGIMESARDLGIYSPETEVDMHVVDYDNSIEAFKVELSVIVHLASAIPDCHYTKTRPIELVFDDFDDFAGRAYGELKWVQTTSTRAGETPKVQTRTPTPFWSQNDSFSISEKIDGNEDTTVQFHYWIWAKAGEVFSYSPARKTEKFTLDITNHLSSNVTLEFGENTTPLKLSRRLCKDKFMNESDCLEFTLTPS